MTHRPSIIKSLHSLKSVTVTAPQYFLERKTRDGWDLQSVMRKSVYQPSKNFIVKSFMTVTVTVPLVIPMIDTWEIDPNFQVSTFTVTNSTRTSQKGYMWLDWYMPFWDSNPVLGLAESLIIVNQWSNFGSHLRSWDLTTVFWLLLTRISDSGWGVLITTIW